MKSNPVFDSVYGWHIFIHHIYILELPVYIIHVVLLLHIKSIQLANYKVAFIVKQ